MKNKYFLIFLALAPLALMASEQSGSESDNDKEVTAFEQRLQTLTVKKNRPKVNFSLSTFQQNTSAAAQPPHNEAVVPAPAPSYAALQEDDGANASSDDEESIAPVNAAACAASAAYYEQQSLVAAAALSPSKLQTPPAQKKKKNDNTPVKLRRLSQNEKKKKDPQSLQFYIDEMENGIQSLGSGKQPSFITEVRTDIAWARKALQNQEKKAANAKAGKQKEKDRQHGLVERQEAEAAAQQAKHAAEEERRQKAAEEKKLQVEKQSQKKSPTLSYEKQSETMLALLKHLPPVCLKSFSDECNASDGFASFIREYQNYFTEFLNNAPKNIPFPCVFHKTPSNGTDHNTMVVNFTLHPKEIVTLDEESMTIFKALRESIKKGTNLTSYALTAADIPKIKNPIILFLFGYLTQSDASSPTLFKVYEGATHAFAKSIAARINPNQEVAVEEQEKLLKLVEYICLKYTANILPSDLHSLKEFIVKQQIDCLTYSAQVIESGIEARRTDENNTKEENKTNNE